MRSPFSWATTPLLLFILLLAVSSAQADTAAEYAKARQRSLELAESLQSYSLVSDLVMQNNVQGQSGGMKLEATQTAHARMPDRLSVAVESPMFKQKMGTGPSESWFMVGGLQACYVGKPVQLSRHFENSGESDLSEKTVFNFYAGLGDFLLTEEREPVGEVAVENLDFAGGEVSCQVFTFATEQGTSKFWFDPETGLVLQARLETRVEERGMAMERILTTKVQSYELNPELGDDLFQFDTPAGLRVVDSLDRIMNPNSMVGMPAPDISFTRLDGTALHLRDLRGQVVFIDFWATWCGPCRLEMPHIEKLYQEFKDHHGLTILGASNEGQGVVEGFLKKNDYSFPIVLVDGNESRNKYRVTSIPAGFVIDAEGIIRAHMIGVQNEDQLRAAFQKAGFPAE